MTTRTTIDAGDRHIRDINRDIQAAVAAGNAVTVVNTLSRHNLGVGLPAGADIHFEGSVGYYCGGLNTGATIDIENNAGWAVGEGMSDGHITVGGYAGMSCGAAMMGGFIHVKGDAGPRCGVAMKGGPTAEEVAEVDVILEPLGLVDSSRNWRKMISGQRLWFFESRDANAWLMI